MFVFAIISIWIPLCFRESLTADGSKYLLPTEVSPIHYTITMAPNFTNATFTGSVAIKIAVHRPVNEIILHQRGLNITKQNIKLVLIEDFNKHFDIKDAGKFGTIEQEFYKITLNQMIRKGGYILSISNFSGSMEQNFVGFYSDSYRDDKYTMM